MFMSSLPYTLAIVLIGITFDNCSTIWTCAVFYVWNSAVSNIPDNNIWGLILCFLFQDMMMFQRQTWGLIVFILLNMCKRTVLCPFAEKEALVRNKLFVLGEEKQRGAFGQPSRVFRCKNGMCTKRKKAISSLCFSVCTKWAVAREAVLWRLSIGDRRAQILYIHFLVAACYKARPWLENAAIFNV